MFKKVILVIVSIICWYSMPDFVVAANVDYDGVCVNGGSYFRHGSGILQACTPGRVLPASHGGAMCPTNCAPVCNPTWGGWSACSATCGAGYVGIVAGNQMKEQRCTHARDYQSCFINCGSPCTPHAWSPCDAACDSTGTQSDGCEERFCVGQSCEDQEPECVPSWGSWSACSATCGGGTRSRTQSCTGNSESDGCNPQPCCGPADRESYHTTSKIEEVSRCNSGDTMIDWIDNSELASHNGLAWTWKCVDSDFLQECISDTAQGICRNGWLIPNDTTSIPAGPISGECLAYKQGMCAYDAAPIASIKSPLKLVKSLFASVSAAPGDPVNPPYDNNDKDTACRFGSFNSVHLVGGVLRWRCGTGENQKRIGDLFSDNIMAGDSVDVDYYGPRTGGCNCECTPVYEYTCEATGTYEGTCNHRCGQSIEEHMLAVKTDTHCFLGSRVSITKEEYKTATTVDCANKVVQCPPCGSANPDGGSYHETN